MTTTAHDPHRTALAAVPTELLIGSGWTPAEGGGRIPVENPATGDVLAEVADGSAADGLSALGAADRARADWAATPARERGSCCAAPSTP